MCIASNEKLQIPVLSCCNASGYVIPPLVIYDRKSLKPEMSIGEVQGVMYGLSEVVGLIVRYLSPGLPAIF